MKKLLHLIVLVGSLALCFACSKDSDSTDPPAVEKELSMHTTQESIFVDEEITFNIRSGNDIVTDAVITQVGGQQLIGYKWKAKEEGTYKFIASKVGYKDSKEVTVVVKVNALPDGKGTFQYGDKTYNIDVGEIHFSGNYYDDDDRPMTQWSIKHFDTKTKILVEVQVATVGKEDDKGNIIPTFPTTESILRPAIFVFLVEDPDDEAYTFLDYSDKGVTVDLKLRKTTGKDIVVVDYKLECSVMGTTSKALLLQYSGEHYYASGE